MADMVFASTRAIEHSTYMSWKIINFLDVSSWQGPTMAGPDVILPTNPETTWKTFIDMEHSDHVLVYTFRAIPSALPVFEEKFQIKYELSFEGLLWKSDGVVNLNSSEFIIKKVFATKYKNINKKSNLSVKTISALLVNDDLNLQCYFRVIRCQNVCCIKYGESPENYVNSLSTDFGILYSSNTLSDFAIVVRGDIIPAHKCILSARSPVFAAMFKSDTMELQTNQLIVQDFCFKTMETLILYLYTGHLCELSDDDYFELYGAADKYQLTSLIKKCAEKLIYFLNVNNVCDVYALGHYYCDAALKSAAKVYMCKNISSVLMSESWRKLTGHSSEIASAMLRDSGIP